ncbi:DUF4435 domain-containing protein [Acinetobacter oleivorans]|uniref:DUF4435 domain-containing protein n=1 Tax=Acinetobacter oleivorans TaxID=1148157 RepID=UPI003A8AC3D6
MVDSNIGFKEKSSYYEKSSTFKNKATIKVFLENFQDSRIWTDAFPESDDFRIHFTTLTVAENRDLVNSPSDGCQKLFELSQQYELGNNLIICLDSDYGYIRSIINSNESTYDRDYIFETYSHSIENTKYFDYFIIESISRYISEDLTSDKFKFIYEYYNDLSKTIYTPFIKTLVLNNLNNESISSKDEIMVILNEFKEISFNRTHTCLDFKVNPKWVSVKNKLSNLETRLNASITSNGIDINSIFDKLRKNNINEDNIYLFIRGHDLAAMLHKHIIGFYEFLFNQRCTEICGGYADPQLKKECKAQFFNNKPSFSLTDKKDLIKHPFMGRTINRIRLMFDNMS